MNYKTQKFVYKNKGSHYKDNIREIIFLGGKSIINFNNTR